MSFMFLSNLGFSLFGHRMSDKASTKNDENDDVIDGNVKKEEYQIAISRDGMFIVTFDTGK